jgi:hypothetical protein
MLEDANEKLSGLFTHLIVEDVVDVLLKVLRGWLGHGIVRGLAHDLDVAHRVVLQAIQQRLRVMVLRCADTRTNISWQNSNLRGHEAM